MSSPSALTAALAAIHAQAKAAAAYDLATVMPIADGLESLQDDLAELGNPHADRVAKAGADLANNLIMDMAGNPSEALIDLILTVKAICKLVNEGASPDTVALPERLGLEGGFRAATDADRAQANEDQPADPMAAEPVSATTIDMIPRQSNGEEDPSNPLIEAIPGTEHESALLPSGEDAAYSMELPEHVDPDVFEDFLSRRLSMADELEHLALDLENTNSANTRTDLKGHIHTLKGEGGVLGLMDLEGVCHAAETHLEDDNITNLNTDLLLEAIDWIRSFLRAWSSKTRPPAKPNLLITRLTDPDAPSAQAARTPAPTAAPAHDPTQAFTAKSDRLSQHDEPAATNHPQLDGTIGLELDRDPEELAEFVGEVFEHLESADIAVLEMENQPDNLETINALFRSFHTIKGLSGFFGASAINAVAHETESLLDLGRNGTLQITAAIIDVVFEAIDRLRKQAMAVRGFIEHHAEPAPLSGMDAFLQRVRNTAKPGAVGENDLHPEIKLSTETLAEALDVTGRVTKAEVKKLAGDSKDAEPITVAKRLVQTGVISAREAAQAMRAAKAKASADNGNAKANGNANANAKVLVREAIKVDSDRLERLIDLIGELVIAESMVCQSEEILAGASPQVQSQLGQLDKITRELQELGTSLRMVPVKATFQRMARMVRDLSRKMDKEVTFTMAGEDTELDKTVVDRIGDPLVHMIRNAIDHGLEPNSAERVANGKPAAGTVTLRSFHKGGSIYIEIADDGRGLNRDKITAKAIEREILQPEDVKKLPDRDVWQLIFAPGFSTAAEVTEVSGRGVGMDVVKRNIEALRGTIEITSEAGKGTTFSIRLPLTLAVIDGMVVRVGSERYIIPTLSIVSSVRPEADDLTTCVRRGELLQQHGVLMTLHRLDRVLAVPGAIQDPTEALVVVVEDEGRHVGLLVDELLGQQQVVIKSLGAAVGSIDGVSGGAILPDGRVGLIVDISGMVRLAESSAERVAPNPVPVLG